MSETAPAETTEPFLPVTLKEDLNQLPSYEHFYKKFETGCDSCDGSSTGNLKEKLKQWPNSGKYKDKIIKACCCMSTMDNEEGVQYKKKCNFFYYWVMDILIKEIGSSQFPGIVQQVIEALEEFLATQGCKNPDPNSIGEDIIKDRKVVYGYCYNYNELKTLLKPHGSMCAEKYSSYLQAIASAYKKVREECEKDIESTDPYCVEFKGKHEQYNPEELLNSTCTAQASDLAARAGERQSILGEKNLSKLGSKIKYYNRFEGQENCSQYNNKEGTVRGKLEECTEIKDSAEKITKTLCLVSSIKGVEAEDETPCYFLYYWLGDIVWKGVGITNSGKFINTMECIYKSLKEFGVNENCKLLYGDKDTNNITKTMFNYWKTVNDFSNDYEDIKGTLKSSKESCDETYFKHLQNAVTAYLAVSNDCKSKHSSYCQEFKKKFETRNDQNPLTLTFTSEVGTGTGHNVTVYNITNLYLKYTQQYQEALSTKQKAREEQLQDSETLHQLQGHKAPPPSAPLIQDPYLSNLPSKKAYDELSLQASVYDNKSYSTVITLKSGLQSAIQGKVQSSDCVSKIASVWYYLTQIAGTQNRNLPSADRCNYFYYWLGDLISEQLKAGNSFPTVMNEVYGKLGEKGTASMCNIIYNNISKENFLKMKKLYDHSQDYATIKQLLQKNGSHCTEELKEYMNNIFQTYDKVKTDCSGTSPSPADGTYCKKFKENYGKYCSRQLAKLSCSEGISTATTAAVSSILGVVGLPVTAFFLHKYNLLPPWVQSTFFGRSNNSRNRRKRRSIKKNFDTLTDDSTEMSTTYSTEGSTDTSTIYHERPSRPSTTERERRNNNTRTQHRNVGYHRI